MTTNPVGLRSRLPLLGLLLVGTVVWKTGVFGLTAVTRTVIVRAPVSYGQVKETEVEIVSGQDLVVRQIRQWPNGLSQELSLEVPLARGTYEARVRFQLTGEKRWVKSFEISELETAVVELP
jgi:hypothetical protein